MTSALGTLSHGVAIHVDSKALLFPSPSSYPSPSPPEDTQDENKKEAAQEEARWFCQENWTPRSGGGRGIIESKIWANDGMHIASSWQDGMMRRATKRSPWVDGYRKKSINAFIEMGKEQEKDGESKL